MSFVIGSRFVFLPGNSLLPPLMMRVNEAFKTQPAIDVVQVECRQVAGHRIELYLALFEQCTTKYPVCYPLF